MHHAHPIETPADSLTDDMANVMRQVYAAAMFNQNHQLGPRTIAQIRRVLDRHEAETTVRVTVPHPSP